MPRDTHGGDADTEWAGAEDYERWRQRTTGQQATAFSITWLDQIDVCLDAQDFVQGVLIEGSGAVVYGESNSGKTFWTTDLSLHIAAGMQWNGRRVEQGAVIYCVLEGSKGFRNRVAAWRAKNKGKYEQCHFGAIESAINLLKPDVDVTKLITAVQEAAKALGIPVKLIVIDTLSRALAGGNENDSEDMGALVQNMDRIRAETGACVLFVHHSGKDQAKGARGHSLLRAAIDTEIEVTADEATNLRRATVAKQRELKKGDVFGFELEVEELGRNRYGEVVTTCTVVSATAPPVRPRKLDDTATLRQEIRNLIASPKAEIKAPEPGMRPAPTVSRTDLQDHLIHVGWLRVEVSEKVSGEEVLPKTEATRLWKRLDALKAKGIVGFNRYDVWLVVED